MKLQPIRNLIALTVCLVWFCTGMQGQVSFAHIGLEDGLSQSTVLSITQDVQGNIVTRPGMPEALAIIWCMPSRQTVKEAYG